MDCRGSPFFMPENKKFRRYSATTYLCDPLRQNGKNGLNQHWIADSVEWGSPQVVDT